MVNLKHIDVMMARRQLPRHKSILGIDVWRCGECGKYKPRSEYSSDRSRGNGISVKCRACDNARRKARRPAYYNSTQAAARREKYAQLLIERQPTLSPNGEVMWLCGECRDVKVEADFYRTSTTNPRARPVFGDCKVCLLRKKKERRLRLLMDHDSHVKVWRMCVPAVGDLWLCSLCGVRRPRDKYRSNANNYRGLNHVCTGCLDTASKHRLNGRRSEQSNSHVVLWRRKVRRKWRIAAANASNAAVLMGFTVKPDRCERCGAVGDVHGHHHSYDFERWLCVEWLCRSCHGVVHRGSPIT